MVKLPTGGSKIGLNLPGFYETDFTLEMSALPLSLTYLLLVQWYLSVKITFALMELDIS